MRYFHNLDKLIANYDHFAVVPGASPKTDIGSFEILSELQRRDVYIYWQQIPEFYHNGDNFDYKIVVDDDSGEA